MALEVVETLDALMKAHDHSVERGLSITYVGSDGECWLVPLDDPQPLPMSVRCAWFAVDTSTFARSDTSLHRLLLLLRQRVAEDGYEGQYMPFIMHDGRVDLRRPTTPRARVKL